MRGEFNGFFIVKLIKKLACALFCCEPLKNRLEHKRSRTEKRVFPSTSCTSSRFLRALLR